MNLTPKQTLTKLKRKRNDTYLQTLTVPSTLAVAATTTEVEARGATELCPSSMEGTPAKASAVTRWGPWGLSICEWCGGRQTQRSQFSETFAYMTRVQKWKARLSTLHYARNAQHKTSAMHDNPPHRTLHTLHNTHHTTHHNIHTSHTHTCAPSLYLACRSLHSKNLSELSASNSAPLRTSTVPKNQPV